MKKILLIDDDPSILLLLKEVFPKEEYLLEYARDGDEGLTKVKEIHPDVIVLDILMPVMNGFEFLDMIKADEKFKLIPIVVYSILQDEKDVETAFDKGAVSYIQKEQSEPKDVLQKVHEIVH